MPTNVALPARLLDTLASSNLMLFVGAGCSSAAGMLCGDDLAGQLAQELSSKARGSAEASRLNDIEGSRQDLAALTQIYADILGVGVVKERVCNLLKDAQLEADKSLAQMIASLRPMTVLTTNYDELLEYGHSRPDDYAMLWRGDQLGRAGPGWSIVKLHGHIDDPGSIVVTKDDYDRYQAEHSELIEHLRNQLRTHTTVVIGSSLEDRNLRNHFKEIAGASQDTRVYVLVRDEADPRRAEWEPYGVKFIHGGIDGFLRELLERDSAALARQEGIPQPRNAGEKADCNPYRYFRTDDVLPADLDVVRRYFTDPLDFPRVLEPGNTVIEGHRGSGKSWILRYLAIDVQTLDRQREPEWVGFYVKCKVSAFDCTRRREDDTDESWRNFFTHYFNTFAISRIVETLATLAGGGRLELEVADARSLCDYLARYIFRTQMATDGSTAQEHLWNLYDEIELLGDACRTDREQAMGGDISSSQALENFMKRLRRQLPSLIGPSTKVFLLLDELDNLDADQQAVVIACVQDRVTSAFSFKIAVQAGHLVDMNLVGKRFEPREDYSYVATDRVAQEKEFLGFLERVADVRLDTEGFNTTIRELLPARPVPEEPTQRALDVARWLGRDFSGFMRYAVLSSGNVRHFVSLLKDTLYFAFPDIATQKVELPPVSWPTQNRVVKMKAAIHFREVGSLSHPEEVETLVSALGGLSREILTLTLRRYEKETKERRGSAEERYDRIRQTSRVYVQNPGALSAELRAYLGEASEVQLLQVPLLPRQPQLRGESVASHYAIHRLLCPYFGISLADRHPRRVDAGQLQRAIENPAAFVAELTTALRRGQEDGEKDYYREPESDDQRALDLGDV